MSAAAGGEIVTPEAVRLDFEEATVGTRAVAILVDWLAQGFVLTLVSLAAGFLLDPLRGAVGDVAVTIVVLVTGFLVVFGYPIAFEVAWRGRTPGKAVMGLRVMTLEGAPVGFRHAAIRAALGLVDFALSSGAGAVFTALLSRRSQRIGDHVAGTVVVRERVAGGRAQAATFEVPHGADAYASTIDPAGARPADYEAARELLLRAPGLPPDRRAALAGQLARSIAVRLSHRIPDEVPAEVFLRCFAARYQARTQPGAAGGTVAAPAGGASQARPARSDPPQPPSTPPPPPPAPEALGAQERADDPPGGTGFAAPG